MIDIIRSFLKGLATPCLLFLACLGVGMVLHTLGYLLFKGFRKKELRSIAFILCCVVATFYGGSKGIRHVTRPPQSNPTDQEGSGTPTQLDTQGQVAFRVVDIALSNDCFTVKTAWTNGLFAAGAKLDYLVKTNLNDEAWTWNGYETVAEGVTNSTHTITLTDFATTVQGADNVAYYVLPSSLFVRVVPRLPVSDMTDSDRDGLPDAYEYHNNTNPWVADYEQAALRVVVNGRTNLQSVVDHCEPYAVVEVAPGTYSGPGWSHITLPPNPILITGRGGVPVFRSTDFASFLLPSNTTEETMLRDIYLDRSATGLQVGFWCGGNLPWIDRSASATFENVYVRFSNPESSCYGWIFYGTSTNRSVLSRCTVNANGAAHVRGVYAINPPPLEIDHASFINFPASSTNNTSAAVLLETLLGISETNENHIVIKNSVFDESFTNAEIIARLGLSTNAPIVVQNSIMPRLPSQESSIEATASLWVTNAALSTWGYPTPGSPVDISGVGSLSILDPTDQQDSDGDGLTDWNEAYRYGTSPILLDSDGDGIGDGDEITDGTNPNDAANFMFNLSIRITNDLYSASKIRYSVISGTLPPYFSSAPTNKVNEESFSNLIATNGCPLVLRFWFDSNTNNLCDVSEWNRDLSFTVKSRTKVITLNLSVISGFDNEGIPEFWWVGNNITNLADRVATLDPDQDGLINLHEYWAGTNPLHPDGSNTLFSILSRSVDERLSGTTPDISKCQFYRYLENGNNGVYNSNTNFWLNPIDLSCVSVWNNGAEPGSMNATAITRKHVILSNHWRANTYVFRDHNGSIEYRNLSTNFFTMGDDIRLAQLDRPLPQSFTPAKILPNDFSKYLNNGKYLPAICINQEKAATVLELGNLNCSVIDDEGRLFTRYGMVLSTNVVTAERSTMRASSYDGNSSCPVFLLFGNEPIFLFSKHLGFREKPTWAQEWGPMVSLRLAEIQDQISRWEGTNSVSFLLDIVNISDFTE